MAVDFYPRYFFELQANRNRYICTDALNTPRHSIYLHPADFAIETLPNSLRPEELSDVTLKVLVALTVILFARPSSKCFWQSTEGSFIRILFEIKNSAAEKEFRGSCANMRQYIYGALLETI